jgi:signal transduction histidine kinase
MYIFNLNRKDKLMIMDLLMALALFVFYFSYFILKEGFLFANAFFIPLVLSCIWFGYRGLYVAFFILLNMILANLIIPYEFFQIGFFSRLLTFVVVTLIISSATEMKKKADEKIDRLNEALSVVNKILRHDVLNDLTIVMTACDLIQTNNEAMKIKATNALLKSIALIESMRVLEKALISHEDLSNKFMKEVVESVIKNYPDIKFKIKGDCTVLCDEAIYPVIDNIIKNAIVHGRSERIGIDCKESGKYSVVRIADYGIGIPDGIKDKIFEEGFSHGDSRSSGLGLYIVKKVVERYGGKIKVEDNKPNGTIFILEFKKGK